jgi:hypothetical protein
VGGRGRSRHRSSRSRRQCRPSKRGPTPTAFAALRRGTPREQEQPVNRPYATGELRYLRKRAGGKQRQHAGHKRNQATGLHLRFDGRGKLIVSRPSRSQPPPFRNAFRNCLPLEGLGVGGCRVVSLVHTWCLTSRALVRTRHATGYMCVCRARNLARWNRRARRPSRRSRGD